MSEFLTKSRARNIFYGGSIFFVVVFIALTVQSHRYVVNTSTAGMPLSEEVVLGKHVWERHSCINCHSLLGEGAYFAPELGNVWTRYGGRDSAEGARAGLKAWIRAQPLNAPGRRVMPKIDVTDEELDALIDFLEWTDSIDTQGWPPHVSG